MPELDKEKIKRCKKKLKEEYYTRSIVTEVTNAIDFDEEAHHSLDFFKSGVWQYIPKLWFTNQTYYPDYVFEQFGEAIAFSEQKHIVESILKSGKLCRNTVERIDYARILEAINNLTKMEPESLNLILFAPIEYYIPMYTDWMKNSKMYVHIEKRNELRIDAFKTKLFWSNNYIRFDDFILFNKSSSQWIAKPNVRNRLKLSVKESKRKGKMEVKAQTEFNFCISNPELIEVLSPVSPPPRVYKTNRQ
jgi:hypothetical protein